jgi:serine/threonine protein kinase
MRRRSFTAKPPYQSDRALKLCDFGLSRVIDIPFYELSSDVITQWYRPPEVLLKMDDSGLEVD